MKRGKTGKLLLLGWIAFALGAMAFVLAQIGSADIIGLPGDDTPILSSSTTAYIPGDVQGPQRLRIPVLGIDSNVQHVGVDKNGNMGVPTGVNKWKDVAWYKLGPKPGEIGNAAVSGHVDNALGMDAVFHNLDELKPGDMIEIEDANGKKIRFRVTHSAVYDYKNAPLEEIFGKSNKARLNLITCTGKWIQSERSYSERLVVYSEAVAE